MPEDTKPTKAPKPEDLDAQVRVRAKIDTTVDGKKFSKDQEGTLTLRQFRAVACNFLRLAALMLLGVLALSLAPARAVAQQYAPAYFASTNGGSTLLNGTTTTVAANTTLTCNTPITLTKFPQVTLAMGYAYTGASTANTVFTFAQSADGANWETTPAYTFNVAGNGTTKVLLVTNLPISSVTPYLRLVSIQNTNASSPIVTNVLVQYGKVPARTGL